MKKLAIVFILSFIWTACENDPIVPENSKDTEEANETEVPSIEEQIKGKWYFEKFESTVCRLSTATCSTYELNFGEGDYFEFKEDTVEYQIFGELEQYPLGIISDDTLVFKNHYVSEYFIIKNLTDNKMTLSFYMDHTKETVGDDSDITDYYYLSK